MPTSEQEPRKDLGEKGRNWIKYSGLGVQMIVTILVFSLAGQYVDDWLGWTPYGTLVLSLTGVATGLYLGLKDFL
ncbi:MAG: AtpZ/AtpI family protein [Bacteroidota bacterium]